MDKATVMPKEELVDFIARLHISRREALAKVKIGKEMLGNRAGELPAYAEVEEANRSLALAKSKLGAQKDNDDTYNSLEHKLGEAQEELNDIEASLSNALTTYMVEHKTKTVHKEWAKMFWHLSLVLVCVTVAGMILGQVNVVIVGWLGQLIAFSLCIYLDIKAARVYCKHYHSHDD